MRLAPLALLLLMVAMTCTAQVATSLRFIQNKGQWDDDIDFQAQVSGGRVGVSATGFSVLLLDMEEIEHRHLESHGAINESNGQPEPINGHYFKINLIGSNPHSKPMVDLPLDGYNNYFLGNDSCRWVSRALAFSSVLYQDVYEGIDFRVSSVGGNLKYDFIVKPGADPSQIKIEYIGVDGIKKLNEELEIQTIVGPVTELKPFSYQATGSKKQIVASEYKLSDNIVSFYFPDNYDECSELVIDPLLIFSTYSGSTADNWGSTATPGEHGTLYSAGVTNQHADRFFPATVGAFQIENHGQYDMAIIKYDSAGTKFLYATHLGGLKNDSPTSLVVDENSGDLIVLGISGSEDFPTGSNSYDTSFNWGNLVSNLVFDGDDEWDIVLTRFSASGDQLIGSTFLGGSGNDGLNHPRQIGGPLVANYGDEMRADVITDATGHVYISSVTGSHDFPIVNGFDNTFNEGTTDGLIVKLSPDLSSIVWSSFLGGSGFDAAYSIKFDNDNNIVLAGGTTSTDFPTTAEAYQTTLRGNVDGWIARVAANGTAIMQATLTGTLAFDQIYFIDLNADGNVFCFGQTAGHMPITPGVYNNANSGQFLQKFSPDLRSLQFSTVFGSGSSGGSVIPNISPTAFLVNDCDNIYMSGWGGEINSNQGYWDSNTNNMPITSDAQQETTSGSDFYFIVLNGDATRLVYSTYLGGNSSKTHVDGGTSRFDKYGIVYHAVCAGCRSFNEAGRSTSDFPTTPNAKSRLNLSTNCNNAAFKFDLSSLKARFDTNNLALTMPGFNNVCYPDTIVFENQSIGGRIYHWDFDDGTVITQTNKDLRSVLHQYQQTGQYHVKLKITDLSTCSQTDSVTKIINYFKDNILVGEDAMVCEGESFQLSASGGVSYSWTTEDGSFSSSQQFPVVSPDSATTYLITVVDANGCAKSDTLHLGVIQDVRARFQTFDLDFSKPGFNNVCYPDSLLFKNLSVNGETFTWDFDDGTILTKTKADTTSIVHGFQEYGVYHVKLKAINLNTCNEKDSVVKAINYFKPHIEVGNDGEICEGTTFQLTATGGSIYSWHAEDGSFQSSTPSPLVQPEETTTYFVTVTDANDCMKKDTVLVTVLDSVNLEWQHHFNGNCTERPSLHVQNLTPPEEGVTFHFDFGDGITSSETEAEHIYEEDGLYALKFIAERKFCSFEELVQLPVYKLFLPNVFTPDASPGLNDKFEIRFGPDRIAITDSHLRIQLIVIDRWGKKVFESQDYKNDWTANDVVAGVYYVHLKVGDFAVCKDWVHIVK